MASDSMNTGWNHQPSGINDIEVGSGNSSIPMWPSSLLRDIFDFKWTEDDGTRRLGDYATPYMTRAEGVRYMGGTWDSLVLDWVDKTRVEVQDRLLAIAQDDALLSASDVLHLRVHTGQFYDESRMWVELHNPFAFQRGHMNKAQFEAFANKVLDVVQDLNDAKGNADAISKKQDRFYFANGLEKYLSSASLALASFFAGKRIEFATIAYLLLHMESYEQVHACLNDLPDDGSAAEISAPRLLALYG
jgi:hypothetical protein